MSQVKTIFTNMSWLVISQIIASICAFIWTVTTLKYLGVSKSGVLAFAISLTGILSFTADFGISTYIVRHIATYKDSTQKYLGNTFVLKSLFIAVAFASVLIILIIQNCNQLTITLTLLFTIEMIIKSFTSLLNGAFQAFEEGKYQGIGNTLLNVILLIFILISIFSDLGIYAIAGSYILANAIALAYCYYVFKKHIAKPKFEFDKDFCKKITLLSLPFAVTGLLYTIYYSIDVVMLTNMIGSYATGIYNTAYKLISVLNLFYSIYIAVIFPVMSRFFMDDEKILLISFEKSVKYLMLVIIPIATATMFYSKDIILLIFKPEFEPASSALSILIWTVCLLFISGACNTLLNASHREVAVTKIYAIAAVFNIALNILMIPYLSYDGAAITTVLSDLLIVIIQFYVIYKLGYRPNKRLYYDLGKIMASSAILAIALYAFNLNMFLALPVGILIYFASVFILRLFDNDDKYVIREILGRN